MNADDDSKIIDFASACIILSLLKGESRVNIVEDPLHEILELCTSTKRVLKDWSEQRFKDGIPEDLPIKISEDMSIDIFERAVQKNWKKTVEKLSDKKRKSILQTISKKYNEEDSKKKEYVMNDLSKEDDKFLLELYKLPPKKLKIRLNRWTSYELENVYEQTKLKNIDPILRKFIENVYETTENENGKTRDEYMDLIYFEFNEHKSSKNLNDYFTEYDIDGVKYKGTFPPTKKYIRNYFMPWLLLSYVKKHPSRIVGFVEENNIYKKFIKKYSSIK